MTGFVRSFSRQRLVATAALLPVLLAACGPEGAAPTDQALDRAREAADALTVDLAGTLGEELQRGGPTAAIKVCSEVAQRVAASHSRQGLTVRRVSLRVRNPADEPDDFERARLEDWEESQRSGGEVSEHVELIGEGSGRELRYLRPIFIASVCLQCHGDPSALVPEVRQLLAEEYPGDRALGYEVSDLRGAVSVRVAAPGH